MAACHYHPDTPGVGICMRCREVVCAACRTPLRGINHCHACLRALARPRPAPARVGSVLLALLLAGLLWAALFGVFLLAQGRLAP